jgi:hypothetical protein
MSKRYVDEGAVFIRRIGALMIITGMLFWPLIWPGLLIFLCSYLIDGSR